MDISSQDPLYIANFAVQCVVPKQALKFTPESIHLLDSFAFHRNTVVEIACKQRSSGCYNGNEKARQSVELKFGDFLDYYQAVYRKQLHWLQTVDELDFYLAQCPIAVPRPNATCTKTCLPAIMDDLRFPECLHDKPVTQVNLWMTVHRSRTTLHYDAYHNVLVVMYGKKTVKLYPPSDTAKMYPFPIYSKSVNHSQVDILHPDLEKHTQFPESSIQQFEVAAGGALFIPEGWWHSVDSDEFTIAINYWWDGARDQLVRNKHMTPYYARVVLEELVKQQCDERLVSLRSSSGAPHAACFIDEIKAAAAVLASKDQGCREQVLLSLEGKILVKTLQFLATNHATEWKMMLANASLDLAAALIECWEGGDLEPNVLNELFRALGDEEESIKEMLAIKQAQFRHGCAIDMYRSLFS
ncbi:hypothetical protein PsorP6_004190 [Peronosclerospora sorghi]|uniref:Uncharacterized protein n=1 Tax=Peronosclerospora sorghi TaxID=230839 RepID=A0ACC0VLG5_9STRA|nr:hypothetical protein PsorP6_004190 [Peronosclerospora sorghi]